MHPASLYRITLVMGAVVDPRYFVVKKGSCGLFHLHEMLRKEGASTLSAETCVIRMFVARSERHSLTLFDFVEKRAMNN